MKDISLLNLKKDVYIYELAYLLNRPASDVNFKVVKDILISNDIIFERPGVGRSKLLTIDTKKLNDFIEETWVWKQFAQYIYKNKLIYDGI